jgi:transposase
VIGTARLLDERVRRTFAVGTEKRPLERTWPPLLPVVERKYRHPGRNRLDDRRVLCGILFVLLLVLYTGIRWEFLPQERGFGSGMTCWRRLWDWNDAGVWQRLHELLLAEPRAADLLDLSGAAVDGSHVRAMKGGNKTGRSPVDRGRTGSKHHVIVEAHGIALAATFRRLRIRWEIRDDIHEAFLTLGCAIICWRRLKISW